MTRPDLLTLLAIASGSKHMAPLRWVERPPTSDEWAAHLMTHALALGRVVDAELADLAREEAARVEALQHLHECQPDQCAAGCPDVRWRGTEAVEHEQRVMRRLCDAALAAYETTCGGIKTELGLAVESYRALRPI